MQTLFKPDDFEASELLTPVNYPELKESNGTVKPCDSAFDKPSQKKKKRKLYKPSAQPVMGSSDSDVRKFHKKF